MMLLYSLFHTSFFQSALGQNAHQHIMEQNGTGTLFGTASDLLVIEQCNEIHAVRPVAVDDRRHQCRTGI